MGGERESDGRRERERESEEERERERDEREKESEEEIERRGERGSNQDQKLYFENLDFDHSLSLSFH